MLRVAINNMHLVTNKVFLPFSLGLPVAGAETTAEFIRSLFIVVFV